MSFWRHQINQITDKNFVWISALGQIKQIKALYTTTFLEARAEISSFFGQFEDTKRTF
jgi:hypothetical protein